MLLSSPYADEPAATRTPLRVWWSASTPAGAVGDDELASLSQNAEVIAYCRGPFCVYADETVRRLRGHGVRAYRLEEGFPEWRRAGLDVAEGGEE